MSESAAAGKRKAVPSKSTTVKGVKKIEKIKAKPKAKIVRDSFTMPQYDYEKIAELKQACLKAGAHVKKSELLRAGLHALCKLSAAQLKRAVSQLEHIKTGRPIKTAA